MKHANQSVARMGLAMNYAPSRLDLKDAKSCSGYSKDHLRFDFAGSSLNEGDGSRRRRDKVRLPGRAKALVSIISKDFVFPMPMLTLNPGHFLPMPLASEYCINSTIEGNRSDDRKTDGCRRHGPRR